MRHPCLLTNLILQNNTVALITITTNKLYAVLFKSRQAKNDRYVDTEEKSPVLCDIIEITE